ncbi:MAG TPA: hypothetical protein VH988_27770 [Thermoanaerobaculia bacterium]|nr:hypothetical protein [Thermoanaerobaculia bacterium]
MEEDLEELDRAQRQASSLLERAEEAEKTGLTAPPSDVETIRQFSAFALQFALAAAQCTPPGVQFSALSKIFSPNPFCFSA